MKIKKVDDKPMVIHTKKKAELHTHMARHVEVKGANVLTSSRGDKGNQRSLSRQRQGVSGLLVQPVFRLLSARWKVEMK